MTTSKTIAALLGPTLIVTALMILFNLASLPRMIEEMSKIPMLIVLSGYTAFVPGLAIIYFHNRWSIGWPLLITLFGWLSVFIGLLRILLPTRLAGVAAAASTSLALHVVLPIIAFVFLFVGGVLSFNAYRRA